MFLDNGQRIFNPINAKTPPPPLWGEILEEENYDPNEEFYDHERAEMERRRRNQMEEKRKRLEGKKLKRKVIYVYEDENGNEIEETKSVSMPPMSRAGNGYAAKSSRIAYGADELTYSNQLIHKPTGVLQPR